MAVEIGDAKLDVRARLAAESDAAVENGRRAADFLHDVIGKGVGLGAGGAAAVNPGENIAAAGAGLLQAPFQPAIVPCR